MEMEKNMKYDVITISREYGALGRTVAKLVSEKLGIEFYDRDFVEKTAKATGYSNEDIKNEGESMSRSAKLLNDFLGASASYVSSYDRIHDMQSEVIRDIAKKPCIIIGRCADFTLTQAGVNVFKVYLYADEQTRIANTKERFQELDEKAIKKLVEKENRGRKIYYKVYTDTEMGDSSNYSLCLNTGIISAEKCADIICQLVE